VAHKPDTKRNLSIKSKLVIIAVMFVVINLVFYLGFDSSDESEKSVESDDKIELNVKEIPELKIASPITP